MRTLRPHRLALLALVGIASLALGAQAAVAAVPARDRTAPTTPTRLAAQRDDVTVRLTWRPSSDARGVAGYRIYRNGAGWAIGTIRASKRPTWTDRQSLSTVTHSYVVRAVDRAGNVSRASTRVVVAPRLPYVAPPATPTPPGTTVPTTPVADPATQGTGSTPTSPTTTPPMPTPPVDVAPPVDPTPPKPPRPWGYASHLLQQSDRASYAGLAKASGARIIRDDAWWAFIEPTRGTFDWAANDELVATYARQGIRMLLIADTTPNWASGVPRTQPLWISAPPIDPARYGDFAGRLAERYGATGTFWAANPTVPRMPLAGIEVWNEPNWQQFWGGRDPDPAHYTRMLVAAHAAIKAADPTMPVLSAGLGSYGGVGDGDCNGVGDGGRHAGGMNPVDFLQAMYANGAAGSMDAVAWHPYVFDIPMTATNLLAHRTCSGWSQMADTPTSARSVMAANGDASKPIWITEFGEPTCVTGGTYGCVPEQVQAELASLAASRWQTYPWSGGFVWYDLRDDGTSIAEIEHHLGVYRHDGTPKPMVDALRTAWLD